MAKMVTYAAFGAMIYLILGMHSFIESDQMVEGWLTLKKINDEQFRQLVIALVMTVGGFGNTGTNY